MCARVCRRFDVLAWTPVLWRTIQLEGENISGDKAIRGVLRQLCGQGRTGACPSVEKVHLTDGCKLTDRSLLLLARRCPELTHLQIQGSVTVTNAALAEVTTRCTNLQHLDVTGGYIMISSDILDIVLRYFRLCRYILHKRNNRARTTKAATIAVFGFN